MAGRDIPEHVTNKGSRSIRVALVVTVGFSNTASIISPRGRTNILGEHHGMSVVNGILDTSAWRNAGDKYARQR